MSCSRGTGMAATRSARITVCTERVGALAQPVESVARHGVAGDDHRLPIVLHPEADARLHRPVVGGGRHDAHAALVEHDALEVLGHLHAGVPAEVLVVGEPVGDVRGEGREDAVHDRAACREAR